MDVASVGLVLLPLLLLALLIFEKRRQRSAVNRARHLEALQKHERYEELDEALDDEAELEAHATHRLSAIGIFQIVHGIIAIGLIGFVLFMVGTTFVHDVVVRVVIAATVGVIGVILLLASIARRNRRERQLLR
jgi:hypothetical protein